MGHHRLEKYLLLFQLSLQAASSLHAPLWVVDKVEILNPPDQPVSGYPLRVLYSCDNPGVVQLECLVSFDSGITSTVLQRRWSCAPGSPRIRTLTLSLPEWLVYRPDWVVPDSQWVLIGTLRASLRRGKNDSALAQDVVILQPTPPLSRPLKQHKLCRTWGSHVLGLTRRAFMAHCPAEQETVRLLSSIYASSGENFGITRAMRPHGSEVLEYLRFKAVSFPWCALSIWVFLTQYCQQGFCGLLHHIDSQNNYASPTLFLTSSGQIHVQMHGESGVSSAFLTAFEVPLDQWCCINMAVRGTTVDFTMVCVDGQQESVHSEEFMFTHPIELDDTDGYLVIGGGQYVRGIKGYYGPLVYYRNRIPLFTTSEVLVPDSIKKINLTGWLHSCQEFQLELQVKISGYLRSKERVDSESCMDTYSKWILKPPLHPMPQCESWESPSAPQRHHALRLAKLLVSKHGGRDVELAAVGRALYSLSLSKLAQLRSTGVVKKILPLLLQAGCTGHSHALHLASVLYNSGLGVIRQPNKALRLSLLGAQSDGRLALLRLGQLHHLGEPGVGPDPDLAYAYYSNIARQTSSDRDRPSSQQRFVESIYLNDEETLQLQTNENHDLFHWLKHQAGNGAVDAEQAVGRMLFWGQQGVSADIRLAVKHYERGAVRLGDPVSMYDYAIVLLQGHGVEQDIPRAVTFLKKAMEKGFTPAVNALGWYYEQFEGDYERAVRLWEQADGDGSPDAAMNLGVMHSKGLYPGQAADQVVAYQYYLRSAQRGQVDAATQLAEVWTTGIPGHVRRRPAEAVLWVKWAAEHNGYLGKVLRKALDSYFKGHMLTALVYYMMAAESGYAAAQFNVAYLCEHNPGGFLDPAFAAQCMRRYYNLTVHTQNPNPYALIKIGDLLYEGHEGRRGDVAAAADMYKRAALHNDPQGWYSLGLLVQAKQRLPLSVLADLGLAELYMSDNAVLLPTLYRRCRDSNSTDSYLPCSLALFNTYLQSIQRDYSYAFKFTGTVVVAVAAPPILLIILGVLRGRGSSHR